MDSFLKLLTTSSVFKATLKTVLFVIHYERTNLCSGYRCTHQSTFSAPDPAGDGYDAPTEHGWGGGFSPHSPFIRCLEFLLVIFVLV